MVSSTNELTVVKRGPIRKAGKKHIVLECSDKLKSNSFKLKEGRFRLDIRMELFTMRFVRL